MSSLSQLYDSAVEAFPRTKMRQHATDPIRIVEMDWIPYLGMKTLFVKGRAQNEGREYKTVILFKEVKYLETGGVKLVASDGLLYHVKPLTYEDQPALVRCDCKDFKWRFNYYDWHDRSLYGNKGKKYESKGGPPANPMEMPGMCKHLMKTMLALRDSGILLV